MEFNQVMNIDLSDPIFSYENNGEIRELISELTVIHQVYGAAIKEIRTKLEILDGEFKVKHDHNPIHHLEYRLKSPRSILEKVHRRNMEMNIPTIRENITDIAGVRVICNYISDVYLIMELLLKHDDLKLLQKKDYIDHPKENGYRSMHLIIEVPIYLSNCIENVPVEVQIRTIGMDYWASLEHHLKYKASHFVSEDIREELNECAVIISSLDEKMQNIFQQVNNEKTEIKMSKAR